ncbi:hypothetical protein CRE_08931 [Caenorhabditis remanei]|uniref:Serpentine receptor class gamma n=1 Tax=Caenorhabditis remanei TaxID=31234 RepID=E3LIC2_CAERE|nr:hypothetical protein CRE_08931 [Caenorhabditis remanei]
MDLVFKPKFGLTLLYGVTGMVLYTWVCWAVVKNRYNLKSSFYKMFVVGYVMNMMTYINSFISLRVPQNTKINDSFASFFLEHDAHHPETKFPLYVFHTLHYQFAYSQYIYNCLLCLNRFTAIFKPLTSEMWWNKWFVHLALAMFLSPFLCTVFILVNRSYYRYNSTGDYFCVDSTFERWKIYAILTPILCIITAANIVCNTSSYLKMKKIRSEGINVIDKHLLQMTFCVFFIDMFLTILSIFNAIITIWNPFPDSPWVAEWVLQLTPFASDVLTLSPPILLLYFSKTVRRKCVEIIPCLRKYSKHRFFVNSRSVAYVLPFEYNSQEELNNNNH